MRLLSAPLDVDRAAEALIEALSAATPYFEEAADAYRDHVDELARACVDEAIQDFEPEPYEEWCASGESVACASRDAAA